MIEFLIGVDGGGTGTRVLVSRRHGPPIGQGQAGPSALGQGIANAWQQIDMAITRAFDAAAITRPTQAQCALGAGLSGVNNPPWREAFIAQNPGYASLIAETDGFAMLVGAHDGRPGALLAAGTGSIGEVWRADGSRASVGGWGFPVGDEGSGAWLGLQAMRIAQCAMDGRAPVGPLARRIWAQCGDETASLLAWCGRAGQFAYAQLAPAVFDTEDHDPAAAGLLARAVADLEAIAHALDPAGTLPLVVLGSVGERLAPRLSPAVLRRSVPASDGPAAGALTLIRRQLEDRSMKQKALFDFKPDARDSSPLYVQLGRKLGQAIRDGRYQADEALPSERVLSESLDVSRVTARKAIDQLVDQGLIVRRRGSGNYIAPRIEQPLSRLTSFSEELHQRGYTPSSQWLERSITAAVPDEQLSLGLSPGARVARLERLRLADEVVMAYEVSVLPQSVLPQPELVHGSLYEYLTSTRQAPVRALQHIRALNAQPRLAEQLGVPVGQAVLFITRIGYLESGQAVELTHSYCRSDYYDFVAEMRREA